MRRLIVGALTLALAIGMVAGPQARAETHAGVVSGTLDGSGPAGSSFTVAFTLVGTVSVGGVPYAGSFTLSGETGGYIYRQQPPYPVTGSLTLIGTTPVGKIEGTCSEPGSTFSYYPSSNPPTNFSMVLRCSAALDSGGAGPLTLTISTSASWVSSPLASGRDRMSLVAGVFN